MLKGNILSRQLLKPQVEYKAARENFCQSKSKSLHRDRRETTPKVGQQERIPVISKFEYVWDSFDKKD